MATQRRNALGRGLDALLTHLGLNLLLITSIAGVATMISLVGVFLIT